MCSSVLAISFFLLNSFATVSYSDNVFIRNLYPAVFIISIIIT